MSLKHTLTNEPLNSRFTNPFALVNHAIGLVKTKVYRGEGMESSLATQVLEIIADGEDHLELDDDEIEEEESVDVA